MGGQRLLDLSKKNLVDLEGGFENEAPQYLILNTNQLTRLSEGLNLPGLTFLDLINNLLDDEAKQQIKNIFPVGVSIKF